MTTRGLCISLACLSLIAGLSAGTAAATTASASTTVLFFVEMEQDGVDSVEGLDNAHSVAVSPDGKHVYATGNGDNAVVVFSRDSATGEITYVEMHEDGTGGVDGLEGAHAVAVTPDGHHVYVTGDEDHAVAAFDRNETTGRLTYLGTIWDSDPTVDGWYVHLQRGVVGHEFIVQAYYVWPVRGGQ
jgi:DNA-binding beta-propeller fold protein YncE